MSPVGIGLITFNRVERIKTVVEQIRLLTTGSYELVVADDGSQDDTVAWCKENGVAVVTGTNRGVCWNKNRALFALYARGCDPILLLEDDTRPIEKGWQEAWRQATERWGHVSYAHPKIAAQIAEGDGSPENPFVNNKATGQCASISAAGLRDLGYFDTRFKGYGVGHAEWTSRAKRLGFGFKPILLEDGREAKANLYISGGLLAEDAPSFRNNSSVQRNRSLFDAIKKEQVFRPPWTGAEERTDFLSEQQRSGTPQISETEIVSWGLGGDPLPANAEPPPTSRPEPKSVAGVSGTDDMAKVRDEIERRLPQFDVKVFVEVGARDEGVVQSVRQLYPGSKLYLLESDVAAFHKISRSCADAEDVQCLNIELRSHAGPPGGRSDNKSANVTSAKAASGDAFLETAKISAVSYLRIRPARQVLEILTGFQAHLATSAVDLIEVEAGLNGLNKKHVPLENLKGYLVPMGYHLFSIRRLRYAKGPYLSHCTTLFVSPALVAAASAKS